jgi:hypothetical protein
MRLLRCDGNGELSLTGDLKGEDMIPPYAILSHTWGPDAEEVTFEDLVNGTGMEKAGYRKIRFCKEQANSDGLKYFWIDTCCINKANVAEFDGAINLMFRWYRDSARCYVYLSDVSHAPNGANSEHGHLLWESEFRKSRWFTRGWTLQELLAPDLIEFYSQEWRRLGDRTSLEQHIHEITGIPTLALQGASLSQFSVNERISWNKHRRTKHEEDRVYSMLGIFDVHISSFYGEGIDQAFKRLMDEITKLENCLQHLRTTDPRHDKKRIEDTNGGLLKDSYCWVFDNVEFQQWRNDQQSRLLWIKGDPGKGKTMLLCGIIDELQKWRGKGKATLLSFYFCQATDSRINNATAVLRGLLYMLVDQQPSLVSHVRKDHDYAGKSLFEDANAWVALTKILANLLQDPNLRNTYLIVDALDECITDLPKLLEFITGQSLSSSRVKWIISSRNWPNIEEHLQIAGHKAILSLELNEKSISAAVNTFIKKKASDLAKEDADMQGAVISHLTENANNTFLWVALVCQNLKGVARRNILKKLKTFPPGLSSLYERMMLQTCSSDDADECKEILALLAVVYRPISIKELGTLVELLETLDLDSMREIVSNCGSFLTIREDTVYFVHQSAKDFLLSHNTVFPLRKDNIHHSILLRSIQTMRKTLRRDMQPRHESQPDPQLDEQLDQRDLTALR